MFRKSKTSTIALMCAVAACDMASVVRVEAQATAAQSVTMIEGAPCIASELALSRVVACPESNVVDPNLRQRFSFRIDNTGLAEVVVGATHLSATDQDGADFKVFSSEEIQDEALQRAASIRLEGSLAALNDTLSALSPSSGGGDQEGEPTDRELVAARPYGEEPQVSNASPSGGGGAPAQAPQPTQRIVDAEQKANTVVAQARALSFPEHTLGGGESHVATATLGELRAVTQLTLTMDVGGEVHAFAWTFTPR